MQQDLPCKDLAESMGRFSGPGLLNGPGAGKVSMSDRPGNVAPIQVRDPKSGTLLKAHWEMELSNGVRVPIDLLRCLRVQIGVVNV